MVFNDSPLPRTQRGLDERRAAAQRDMRRASWLAYVVAALNAGASYLLAEHASRMGRALVPLGVGLALAVCGYALMAFQSRVAAIGLLLGAVATMAARWVSMGGLGPVIPGLVALYVFWQGFEAASEWARLRGYMVPTDERRMRD